MVKTDAQPGDYVEVHLMHKIYDGFLLESPESEKETVLFKLNNGYNIGLNKKDVVKIVVKKKYSPVQEKFETHFDSSKPNIAIVMTGGTIANRLDSKTGGVAPLTTPENLFKFYPEIFDKVNVIKVVVPFMKASESMNFSDWKKIAKLVSELINDTNIQGVIVTHGTDTLHYTSSALTFMLRNLNKPVVLTYSQRSSDRASSDANLNLKCASIVATSKIAEVVLVGHATTSDDFCFVMRGTKVRKMHSSRRDTFRTINSKPIAKVYENSLEILGEFNSKKENFQKCIYDGSFFEKVALLKFYPGQDPTILDYYVKNGYKGIIIEGTGLGHVAINSESKMGWDKKLKEVISKGLTVCITTQCVFGKVDAYVYSNLRKLNNSGVIFLDDMISETAFVKLGWVLGHPEWAKDKKLIREKMLENISGEFSERLEE